MVSGIVRAGGAALLLGLTGGPLHARFAWRIAAQSGAMENRLDVLEWFKRGCP